MIRSRTQIGLAGIVLGCSCGGLPGPIEDAATDSLAEGIPGAADVPFPSVEAAVPVAALDAVEAAETGRDLGGGAEVPGADTWPDAVDARDTSPDAADARDTSPDAADARDTWDPNCHYDCFGFTECKDGVITLWDNTPVPCQYWTGSCPRRQIGTCQGGCAQARLDGIAAARCPTEICLENYPKQPGDPCTGDAQCRPTRATAVDGGVAQTYLRCDVANQVCVATPAPALGDWLAPCDAAIISTLTRGAFGARTDPSCSGGLCAFYAAHEQTCVYQGCSKACHSDDECPAGAVCQIDVCPASSSVTGYCKPGPLNQIGTGLPCVP